MNTNAPQHDDAVLDTRLAALTREAPPREAVWTGIEAHLRQPPARRWPWTAAAAAVLAVVIVLLQRPFDDPTGLDADRVLVQAEAQAMRQVAPMATGGLEQAVPLAAAWAENQTAIEELEAALLRDPDNRLLLEFLAEARLRQARLLNSGLTLSPPTRMTL